MRHMKLRNELNLCKFDIGLDKYTNVSALVGSLGLVEHLIEVLFELFVPFHELVYEHHTQSHAQHVLPRI